MSIETPVRDAADLPLRHGPRLPLKILILFVFSVIVGGMLGAGTNAVNGYLSPIYFVDVMGWDRYSNIWNASILQGALEGSIYGAFFSGVFVALISAMSHGTFRIAIALRYVLLAFAIAVLLWSVGGLIAVLYAWIVPSPSRRFFGSHGSVEKLLAYAWVRGSIWGGVFGGPYAVGFSLAIYARLYCGPLNRTTSQAEVSS